VPGMTTAPETPADSPLTIEDVMRSPAYRDLSTPKLAPGDSAYPFELPRDTGEIVRLADYAGRLPVALVFGSYT
jgi:hypothetical protein